MTNIHLVYGAPLSGKSTFVKQQLKDNDLVFDYDDVMRSLTGLTYQSHNENVQPIVLDIRTLIINHIKDNHTLDNVYIITTFISNDLEQQLNGLSVEKIRMDTDFLTCIERLADSEREHKAEVRFVILDWFNEYYNKGIVNEQYGTERNKKKFYTGSRWYLGTREAALRRDNYECQLCKRKGKVTIDSIKQDGIKKKPTLNVHHVMEIEYHPEHAYNLDNLITVCIGCHNRIHNKQDNIFQKQKNKWADDEQW